MFIFVAIQKWLTLLAVLLTLTGGTYLVERMSWVREDLGHVIQVRRVSGSSWSQLYEYDRSGRLLCYKYSDSQARNHVISYDPDNGDEIEHRVD